MIKVGSFFRQAVVSKLKNALSKSESIFVLGYSGLTSNQMVDLRNSLRQNQSQLLVAKNSLMHRALKDSDIDGLNSLITGPTAMVFGRQDIADTAKVLTKFVKANQSLVLKGAFSHQRILNNKDIEVLSKLPSKELLRAQLVMTLKSPLAGLIFTLKGNLNKLVVVLNQIKEKKGEG